MKICGKCTELVMLHESGLHYCNECGIVEGCVDLDPGELIENRYTEEEGWNFIEWEDLYLEFDVVINHKDDFEIEFLLVLDGEGDPIKGYNEHQVIELIKSL